MKKLLLILLSILLYSCAEEKGKTLTFDQLEKEKEAIKSVITTYNQAIQSRNFSPIVELLSKDVIFFGSDSTETIKSIVDFKLAVEEEWSMYEKVDYGEMQDFSIFMDDAATIASVIYGLPATYYMDGVTQKVFLRYARTLKKESRKWLIISGIVGITRPNTEIFIKEEVAK
ncbi:MAG: nuclear transport factor 2 family protein [Ignavibacteria bacterium]|nr:nuclear transport factor 2 family protein [Ignavibacteria bacterium]